VTALGPARTLKEAYRFCDPMRPLNDPEWQAAFYVERSPDSRIDTLQASLELDDAEDDKTIVSSQVGVGETTELYRLAQALEETHEIIFFDVVASLNLGDIHYTDLLVQLGLTVYQAARRRGIPADESQAEGLRFWYEQHELIEAGAWQLESGAEIDLALVRFTARLSEEKPFRHQVRATAEAHLSDLLERLNGLLEHLRARFGRRLLVIVDGLDKVFDLELAAKLLLHGANALLAPTCRMIYTVPFPLFYSDDFQQVRHQFHRTYLLPCVKVREQDGAPYRPGRDMLTNVVRRRVHSELITDRALHDLVEGSGGIVRELLRLARLSIVAARQRGATRVERQDVRWARREVRSTYRRLLTVEDYPHLWQVVETKRIDRLPREVSRKLLHNMSVLEYNGDTWWDVHPAVRELLEQSSA